LRRAGGQAEVGEHLVDHGGMFDGPPEEGPMPRKPKDPPVYFLVALLAATLLAGALLALLLAS